MNQGFDQVAAFQKLWKGFLCEDGQRLISVFPGSPPTDDLQNR